MTLYSNNSLLIKLVSAGSTLVIFKSQVVTIAQIIANKKPKNAVFKPYNANRGFLATMARETKPKGGRAGAITIEPIKIGIELVSKATAARTPAVAIKTK